MRAAIASSCFAILLACGQPAPDPTRCAQCGMRVADAPRWNAGLTAKDGRRRIFDTPACMLRFARGSAGRGATSAWVRDYYGQKRVPAAGAFFVVGSDVLGPMGHDLVPVADRPAAERFLREHHGRRILRFAEVDRRQLETLTQ